MERACVRVHARARSDGTLPMPMDAGRKARSGVPEHEDPKASRGHICAGTGLPPSTSAPGTGLPLPYLRRDWVQPERVDDEARCGDEHDGVVRVLEALDVRVDAEYLQNEGV